MAHREKAPYAPQDHHEVRQLIQSLESHKGRKAKGDGGFSVKKATFTLPNGRSVDSWRMNDWDYKKPSLPTYARGLFTYQTLDGNYEIAVRGYDKFFNHQEVRATEWRNVEQQTRGPYELSVKENGCIIFIAGLDDGTLLVCSKHSTGSREGALAHAVVGEQWVEKHLAKVGKTKADLAKKLREMNATCVAELCDDSFEEHVLAYTPEQAGLYVHGINLNLPGFATYPGHLVDKFADEWGMKKVMYVMEDDITKVKTFLDKVAETGNYDGRDTEGFVIRCQRRVSPTAPWEDWFFKYKFEEPYLMYRQWRECTKAIIAGKPPRFKKHQKITEEYLAFARKQFVQKPGLAKEYNMNHGIIKMRDDFLNERGLKGSDIIKQEIESGEVVDSRNVVNNVVLVPAATIGCGKTTVALALVKLFGWGHFQNDNITSKKNRPQIFAKSISSLLTTHPVVIADRNNHQKREREQLITDVSKTMPQAKFVALHYVHEPADYDRIRDATRNRVLTRGDNHQTIQAGSKGPGEIIEIMEGFMHRFQPVDPSDAPDDGFDLIIDLDPVADSRENLEVIVARLQEQYPKLFGEMPNDADLDDAISWAMNEYNPSVKVDLSRKGKQPAQKRQNQNGSQQTAKAPKVPKMEYFGVKLNSQRINAILEAIFRDKDPQAAKFFRQLQQTRRIQPEFHVTLCHRLSAKDNPALWDNLIKLNDSKVQRQKESGVENPTPELGVCDVRLERLVWDSRVMCVVVRLDGKAELQVDGEHKEVEFQTVNPIAHVTIGTRDPSVKPVESNALLQRWLQDGSGEKTGIFEETVKGNVVLPGTVRGVLQRL